MEEKRICPSNHLTKAILTTIFCCLPFGIVAIVKASKVNNLFISGNYEQAEQAAKDANKWANIALWVGVAVYVIYIIYMIVVGSALLRYY